MPRIRSGAMLVVLAIAFVLALPISAHATPYNQREHVRGADGVSVVWDGAYSINQDIQAGEWRFVSQYGSDKEYGGFSGLKYHYQKSGVDYFRYVWGDNPDAQLVMDNKLTSASIVAPVVVVDDVWVGPQFDSDGNLLPPTTTSTYTVLVSAQWVATDEPLYGGPQHMRDVQQGYTYEVHSNGKARDVVPVGHIVGFGGEVLFDGTFTWGGMYDFHDFSMDKFSEE